MKGRESMKEREGDGENKGEGGEERMKEREERIE